MIPFNHSCSFIHPVAAWFYLSFVAKAIFGLTHFESPALLTRQNSKVYSGLRHWQVEALALCRDVVLLDGVRPRALVVGLVARREVRRRLVVDANARCQRLLDKLGLRIRG